MEENCHKKEFGKYSKLMNKYLEEEKLRVEGLYQVNEAKRCQNTATLEGGLSMSK